MDATGYKKRIAELERENRILKKKLERSEANRALVEEILETHSRALKVRNDELEKSWALVRKSEARFKQLAHHDILTGLPNRTYFQEQLDHAVETAKKYGTGLALLFIDLDRFKPINDNYGHRTGDIILMKLAKALKSCIRGEDIIARIGGDEFAIIIRSVADLSSVSMVCERIMQKVNEPIVIAGRSHQIGISIGISLYPKDASDPEGLLKTADQAMYIIKKSYEGGYRFYGFVSGME